MSGAGAQWCACPACMWPWAWLPTLQGKEINDFPFLSIICGLWPSVVNLHYYPLHSDLTPHLSLSLCFSFSFLDKALNISGWRLFARKTLNHWCPPTPNVTDVGHHSQFLQFRSQAQDFPDARQALYIHLLVPREKKDGSKNGQSTPHTIPYTRWTHTLINLAWCESVISMFSIDLPPG